MRSLAGEDWWFSGSAASQMVGQSRSKNGGKGIRTPDIQLAKLALYQLSYAPVNPVAQASCLWGERASRPLNLEGDLLPVDDDLQLGGLLCPFTGRKARWPHRQNA